MSIYEYNEEEHMRMEREEYFEMGYQKGREEQLAIVRQERQRAEHAEELIQQISRQAESADAKIAQLQQEIARLKNQ